MLTAIQLLDSGWKWRFEACCVIVWSGRDWIVLTRSEARQARKKKKKRSAENVVQNLLVQNPAQLADMQHLSLFWGERGSNDDVPTCPGSHFQPTFSVLLRTHVRTLYWQFLSSFCSLIFLKILWLLSQDEKQDTSVTVICIKTFRISPFLSLSFLLFFLFLYIN